MRVSLSKGDTILEIDPWAGGSVSALRHRDLHVLRPAPDRIGPAFDARKYAAFPMVPFVGRIRDGQFQHDGETVQLHANMPPEPHAIHGHGWQDCWKVTSSSKTTATLRYVHVSDAWPWDYEAEQIFKVLDHGIDLTLSVTNHGSSPMPSGLGWHPYFHRKEAILRVNTVEAWTSEIDPQPTTCCTVKQREDLSRGRVVESLNVDKSFRVGSNVMEFSWPTHSVTIKSDPIFKGATVYVPPGEDFFCAEPITHIPDAINSELSVEDTGLQFVAPGQTLSGKIKLRIEH